MTIDSTRESFELGGHSEAHDTSPSFESANEDNTRNDSRREDHSHGESAPDRGDDDAPASGPEAAPADANSESTERRRRRRGSRGGRRRRGARKGEDGEILDENAAGTLASEEGALESDEATSTRPATAPRPQRARAPRSSAAPREIGFEDIDAGTFAADDDAVAAGDDETPQSGDAAGAEAPRKKSRRRRRGRGQGAAAGDTARPQLDSGADDGPVEPFLPDEDDLLPRAKVGVPRDLDQLPDEEDAPLDLDAEPHADGMGGGKKRRRRGSRGGRRRKQQLSDGRIERPTRNVDLPAEIEAIPGEEDDLPILTEIGDALDPADSDSERGGSERGGPAGRSRRGKKRGGDKRPAAHVDADDEDLPVIPESQRTSIILVNATDPEEQRVAVCEGERIVDFQMTVRDQDSLVNDIYRGRVVNLEPAIGAAFIDFGQGRNGFLHTSDVLSIYGDKEWSLDKLLSAQIDPEEWDSGTGQPQGGSDAPDDDADDENPKQGGRSKGGKKFRRPKGGKQPRFRARPRLPITELLKKGQMVVVQVTKDAIGDKGPTLTTYISIPGRYLVLMPSMSRTGVSRKIEDEKERKRLKRILTSLDVPEGMGVIVRTAGVGHSKAEIKRDLDYLKGAWEAFGNRLNSGHGPAPLYRESDVAIRTMRDLFTPTTKAVVVDDPEVHRHITEFAEKLMPEDVQRVKLHTGARPLFQSYGIEPDFEKIFSRRIELPSGGSVVFDSAEALVAIDVNSGRTRSDGFDFEEIALKTNLEAVPEIARQIRLRDLGGIIVVDFIDMMKMGNIRTVERSFAAELENDRARSKIGRISQFGLLELTRQRLGPGIAKKAFHSCPRCRGTGRIRTVNSRAAAILRRLGSAMILKGFSTVEVKAHPEVIAYLKDSCSEYIRALEYRFTREVKLYDAPEQHEDSVLRYLRADGKEVRPGGRRKR
ncbi:MAG: Rne/Rng family ribonuclease [Planctomycetota bacterium]|nr:Rne/Rng family ribonuclease [Planctomycetota bacterium]